MAQFDANIVFERHLTSLKVLCHHFENNRINILLQATVFNNSIRHVSAIIYMNVLKSVILKSYQVEILYTYFLLSDIAITT